MVQGVYVPAGTDGEIVAALEKFGESLIGVLADAYWEETDTAKDDEHNRAYAEVRIAEALRSFLQHGDWRTYR